MISVANSQLDLQATNKQTLHCKSHLFHVQVFCYLAEINKCFIAAAIFLKSLRLQSLHLGNSKNWTDGGESVGDYSNVLSPYGAIPRAERETYMWYQEVV